MTSPSPVHCSRSGQECKPPFLDDFRPFQQRISQYGLLNSLAQTLLKLTAPGVPDTYQGTEVWDFSLVDPDNRRLRGLCSPPKNAERFAVPRIDPDRLKKLASDLLATPRGRPYQDVRHISCLALSPRPSATFRERHIHAAENQRRKGHASFGFARNAGTNGGGRGAAPDLPANACPSQLPLGPEIWQTPYSTLTEFYGACGGEASSRERCWYRWRLEGHRFWLQARSWLTFLWRCSSQSCSIKGRARLLPGPMRS